MLKEKSVDTSESSEISLFDIVHDDLILEITEEISKKNKGMYNIGCWLSYKTLNKTLNKTKCIQLDVLLKTKNQMLPEGTLTTRQSLKDKLKLHQAHLCFVIKEAEHFFDMNCSENISM